MRRSSLTSEPGQTPADEARCVLEAELGLSELGHQPIVRNVRTLKTFALVLTRQLLALVHVHLAVLPLVACTEGRSALEKLSSTSHTKPKPVQQ